MYTFFNYVINNLSNVSIVINGILILVQYCNLMLCCFYIFQQCKYIFKLYLLKNLVNVLIKIIKYTKIFSFMKSTTVIRILKISL